MKKALCTLAILLMTASYAEAKRIYEYTNMTAPASTDELLISDTSDSNREFALTLDVLTTYLNGQLGVTTPSTLALTTDTSVSEAQLLANKFITNQAASGEVDITLPAVSYHITRTVIAEEAQIIEMNPPSGESFDLSGTILDADDCIDSPATVGAKAVFTRMQDATGAWFWSVDIVRGTWTDTGASD